MKSIYETSKKYLFISMVITLTTISNIKVSEAGQDRGPQKEVGRYQVQPVVAEPDRTWSWVIDSKTGRVRLCRNEGLENSPKCTPWSDN